MADDLDDLLDEVESKFVENVPQVKTKSLSAFESYGNGNSRNHNKVRSIESYEIDDLLRDDPPLPPPVATRTSLPTIPSSAKTCYPVFLGGSSIAVGCSRGDVPKSCSKLRCLECDFLVSMFDHFKWSRTTDYLFLRNNMPDFVRLKANLIPSRGVRAYACQCRWRSVLSLVQLETDHDLKWVCCGH